MMMNRELQQHEPKFHDLDLPGACLGCGGPIAALAVERTAEGVRVVQLPGGLG